MRIGIVTFYRVPNYGAMLQAYALQSFLEARGHMVVFLKSSFAVARKNSLLHVLCSRSIEGIRIKLQHNYNMAICDGFKHYLKESDERIQHNEGPQSGFCDAYIVGSDQMWNPTWCEPFLTEVFLDFAPSGGRRIAYAVSFGVQAWPDETREAVKVLIKRFDAVSVREHKGIDLVQSLAGVPAKWVPDPTLLHEASFYNKLLPPLKNQEQHHTLFKYILSWETEDAEKYVDQILKTCGLDVVESDCTNVELLLLRRLKINKRIAVKEWLQEFRTCSFVLTNSFHGTVFALIYKRPFITLCIQGKLASMNDRVVSLLTSLGLQDRIFNEYDENKLSACLTKAIDWDGVYQKINKWRCEANGFFSAQGM